MLLPTLFQKYRMPIASESREHITRPPAADTTDPEAGYKLTIRSATFGFERSYASRNTRCTSARMLSACAPVGRSFADREQPSATRTRTRIRIRMAVAKECSPCLETRLSRDGDIPRP